MYKQRRKEFVCTQFFLGCFVFRLDVAIVKRRTENRAINFSMTRSVGTRVPFNIRRIIFQES